MTIRAIAFCISVTKSVFSYFMTKKIKKKSISKVFVAWPLNKRPVFPKVNDEITIPTEGQTRSCAFEISYV